MGPIDLPKETYDLLIAEEAEYARANPSLEFSRTERKDDPWRRLRTQLNNGNKRALEYESYASSFYDTCMPAERCTLSSFDIGHFII